MQKVENEKRLYGVKMPTDVSESRETIIYYYNIIRMVYKCIILAPSVSANKKFRQDVG